MFEYLVISFSSLVLMCTILPLIPLNHWFFRGWEFPRVQISVISFLAAFICALSLESVLAYIFVGALLVAIVYQFTWIYPYTQLAKTEVNLAKAKQENKKISILSSNVLMTNHSAEKLLNLIELHHPDVIVTLESDQWWQTALACIHDEYPYRLQKPLDNLYGMHLYSKYPFQDMQIKELIEEGVPSMHGYLCLDENTKVKCHFLHPAPPSPTENETSTPRDVELLVVAKEIAANTREPTLVAGDLNDVAWSPTTKEFKDVSGLKDPRIGRGMFNTFHADYALCRWPLDHIFHSDDFKLVSIQRLDSIDSDHFPLLTVLALNGERD